MLSRNDQLVPEGQGRRAKSRGTCYVDEPPFGFFIAGSTIKTLNGVYVRRNAPRGARVADDALLYYVHMSSGSTMVLAQAKPAAAKPPSNDYEDDEDDVWGAELKKPVRRWIIVDEKKVDRFQHPGDTIVPGAGVRWTHVHAASGETGASTGWRGGAGGGAQIVEAVVDDQEELPWQVIAILDMTILEQLMGGARYHERRVAEAVAGRGDAVKRPALTSPEALAEGTPGSAWVYRVCGSEGIVLRSAPRSDARRVGARASGDYVRAIETRETPKGTWVRLDVPAVAGAKPASRGFGMDYEDDDEEDEEDEDEDYDDDEGDIDDEDLDGPLDGESEYEYALRVGYALQQRAIGGQSRWARRFFNAEHATPKPAECWAPLNAEISVGAATLLERVDAADAAALDRRVEGETLDDDATASAVAASGAAATQAPPKRLESLAGEFLDAPFVARLDGGAASASSEDGSEGGAAAAALDPIAIAAVAAAAAIAAAAFPVGAAVVVSRLTGIESSKYNGVTGVVVSGPSEEARQSVRLDAPFSGKRLLARPTNIFPIEISALRGESSSSTDLHRAALALGLSLAEVSLAKAVEGTVFGFRIGGGTTPNNVLNAALRAALRDSGRARDDSAAAAAKAAHLRLATAIAENTEVFPENETTMAANRSPDLLVRCGVLGARAAAAARSAVNASSPAEADKGIAALGEVLLDELDRVAESGEDPLNASSDDALRLRVTIVYAHLAAGRDAAALAVSAAALEAHPHAPVALWTRARALLRLGKRSEAKAALEKAAAHFGTSAVHDAKALGPDAVWASAAAHAALQSTLAAERGGLRAADAYERGSFLDAAAAYRAALSALEAGIRDDRHGRAALFANVAACLRRAKDPLGAVAACDAALLLLPRYTRAIFRRACALLEAADTAAAVEGFESLYRVDRMWPKLSDWLVRAHAAYRRASNGKAPSPTSSSPRKTSSSPSSSPAATAASSAGPDEREVNDLAAEKDHYVVLGLTHDATDKQIKAAYRMRSLRFHPDRAGASCTAAFQRVAAAFTVLSDSEKRATYDEGGDVKGARKDGRDDDSEEEAEEHKQSLREEIERKFYPERFDYWPFGDPFVHKRKLAANKNKKAARRDNVDEDDW